MNSATKVFDKMPADFAAKVEVAAVYVNVNGKILVLQIADHKVEKGAWGVPGGKLEAHEKPLQAAQRELFEETGIHVDTKDVHSFGPLYIRKPQVDYVYHQFEVNFDTIPHLTLSREHCAHTWVSQEETAIFPLMDGGKQVVDIYFKIIENSPNRK